MLEQKQLIQYLMCSQKKINMNESGALVNCYDEKVEVKEPKDKNKKESCLDVLSDIGEGICDVITSVLD